MEVTRVAMNPWDFTLYRSIEGILVIKVIFSEGQYKTDVGRYFEVASPAIDVNDVDALKRLAAQIRQDYPDVSLQEIAKADVAILK